MRDIYRGEQFLGLLMMNIIQLYHQVIGGGKEQIHFHFHQMEQQINVLIRLLLNLSFLVIDHQPQVMGW